MKQYTFGLILILSFGSILSAENAETVVQLYRAGAYDKACRAGMHSYYAGNRDAHFAAMTGMACAKADSINALGSLQRNLIGSTALRSSAVYFSTLILLKRLLYQHFVDGISLQEFQLPKYDHILSVVFDHLKRGTFERLDNRMVRFEEGKRTILVSLSQENPPKLIVDEYAGAILLKRHWYQ